MKLVCQKCNKETVRIGVNLFLDIPAELYAQLSKKNLRREDVHVQGAGWDRAYFYCTSCGWNTHLSEIDRLRKELAKLREEK